MAKPYLVTSASQSPLFLSFRDRGLERKFVEDHSAKARSHDLQVGSLDAWPVLSSTEQHALRLHTACLLMRLSCNAPNAYMLCCETHLYRRQPWQLQCLSLL
jgi:hypothetical protein